MKSPHLDPLTKAHSRATLGQQMTRWIDLSQANGSEFSVFIIDLDYFKSINDAFGHQRGDQALIEVTARIKASIRRQDQLYRYGGDEFVVLLPNSSKAQAIKVAERIRETLNGSPLDGAPPVKLSASYGLASYPEDASTPESLFAVMDHRLYQGKALGRGRIIAGDSETNRGQLLRPPDRLVERDLQYQQAQRFLADLPSGGGLLQAAGRAGSGRTRFLTEVARLARLQGYAVWAVKGSPALRFRKGGALVHFERLAGLAHAQHDPQKLLACMQNWVADQGLAGLLLVIDGVDGIDSLSLEVLGKLLLGSAEQSFPLGLMVSGNLPAIDHAAFDTLRLRTQVELKPVTEAGLRIWLRYSLNWEPPEPFITWFYQQTGGQPSAISAGLAWMHQQGLLRPGEAEGWAINRPAELPGTLPLGEDGPKSNLPPISTDLFGREEELWQIKDLLLSRLPVTICGPDGMGKSRLALQAAAELGEGYPDGVFWLALNDRLSREDLLFLLAHLMDYPVRSQEKIEDEIFQLYREKQILLVLDALIPNSPAALLAARLAQFVPSLQLLLTAAQPLNFPGERTLTLSGLPFPENDHDFESYPAVQLFLAGARGSLAAFQPDARDRQSIARICGLVEGVPLAIELAGVWVSSFSCHEIAGQIEQNIQFLGLSAGARPNSFTAVVDSFWQLFSRYEQGVLSALSVFSSDFSAQAAAYVADASPFFLDALIAKKYLHIAGPQRYTMHFLLARHAAGLLRANPTLEDSVRRRHAEHYLGKLTEKSELLAAWNIPNEFQFQNLDNFRQAWEFAVRAGDYDWLRRSLDGLFALFFNIGHFQEGIRLLSLALEGLPHHAGGDLAALRAALLTHLGEYSFHVGQYRQGQPVLEEAVRVLKTLDAPGELAEVLRLLANLVGAMGDYDRAIALLQEGLTMTSEDSAPHLYFNLINRAGVMAYFKKDFAQADEYFQRALVIARRVNDTGKIAVILNNRGNIALDTGELERARSLLVESNNLCGGLSMVTLHASVLDTLAKVESARQNIPAARQHFTQSLRLLQENDAVPLAMEILIGIAEMWHRNGQSVQAAGLVHYIQKYGTIPNDVNQRAVALAALVADQPDGPRWQESPLKWVIQDVLAMLADCAALENKPGVILA